MEVEIRKIENGFLVSWYDAGRKYYFAKTMGDAVLKIIDIMA